MGALGSTHGAFGICALVCGLVIFRITKGTRLHRAIGYLYVASMLGLNATGLMMYELFGFFGPFHVLAVVSLMLIALGFYPVYFMRPAGTWLRQHYDNMCWSYVSLSAAAVVQAVLHLGRAVHLGSGHGVLILGATIVSAFVVFVVGAAVLRRYRDRLLAAVQRPATEPNHPLQTGRHRGVPWYEVIAAGPAAELARSAGAGARLGRHRAPALGGRTPHLPAVP